MQEDKHRQLHINFELSNNINSAKRMLASAGFHERSGAMKQIISLLTYKYLSESIDNFAEDIGYRLDKDYRYNNLLINKGDVIGTLKSGINQITQENDNPQAANVFFDLFDIVDFERFNKNETWLVFIDVAEKICSETTATIGEIIIFLIKNTTGDKRDGIIHPTQDIIKLITTNQSDVKNIYDPYVVNGTLLAEVGNIIDVKNYYGQHPNKENCILTKMTLLTNNVNYKNIFIKRNEIAEPEVWNDEFDLCISIPPFGEMGRQPYPNDPRFEPYAPKRVSELAYLLDMLYNLAENGTIKMFVPDKVLRGGINKKIIKYLVDEELISTIITLPEGLFKSVKTPTSIITVNQKPKDGIYYLNLREVPTEQPVKKHINMQDIDKYTSILANQKEVKLLAKIATIDEIRENDYNLAINRYVDQEELEEIDIRQTIANIKTIKKELKQVDEELNAKIGGLFN